MNEFQNLQNLWRRYMEPGPERANDLDVFNPQEIIDRLFGNQPGTNTERPAEQPTRQPTGQQAGQRTRQPTEQIPQGIPPASARAIRQLPTICVTPEDLVDPNNRECCICLETISLGNKVTRIPCAHIFHQECIVDWLSNHHCTCPVCRYELQTNNPMYEAGRLERMKKRKPRFAMYELKRMSVPELLALNRRPAPNMVDKDELINLLARDEQIEIVPSPEPVEYDIDTLKAMRISELKLTMESAGVFFHAKDVVEKSDMLAIFLNSGRLSLSTPENKAAVADTDSSSQQSMSCKDPEFYRTGASAKRPFVETVEEDSDNEPEQKKAGACYASETVVEMFGSSSSPSLDRHGPPNGVANEANSDDSVRNDTYRVDMEPTNDASIAENDSTAEVEGNPVGCQSQSPAIDSDESISEPLGNNAGTNQKSDRSRWLPPSEQDNGTPPDTTYLVRDICPFEGYSVSHLRDLARINNVDLSCCFERSDIVRLLTNSRVEMKHPSELLRDSLSNFSISELGILASEVKLDLSKCKNREDILSRMVQEATVERPYLQKYLRSLCPLSTLSLGQLKKTARDWGVNINDCLERGEIMQRLVASRHTTARS
ncbi:unnamed protein product [Cylindrotheca closterium]|uniref:RING-type domain-containing protein n=1 Tax=Cylindrotheca closterium TaxID=2856 RepID=A0AAD2G9T0_9STRA|nr:unnamed protein product [Cylindrotheca closterium]